jgi:outer membrane protein assembly factor BamB
MSITGALTAWDADSGKQLWRRDYDSAFGKSHPYWGAATSPIVAGDLVLVHFGTDEAGTLAALDADSGQEVWTVTGDGPSYSSPLVVEIDGVRQVVEWNHQALVGIDIATGQSLWEFPFPHVGSDQNMPTPVFHQGRVLLGAENRGIHGLEPRLHDGAWSVEKVWSQEDVALNMSSAVVNDGLLFGFSHYDRGRFFSLDPATGQVLWKGPPRTGDNAALLSLPGHVLLLTDDGQLRIIRATGDGYEPVATYHVAEGDTWAPPVLLADGILVKALDTLTLWKLPGSPAADPPGE